mmetsp:Transcript_4782/g.10049  ORF Transcript_4782/g.10049 Transcript_4782/m.10049 type:complete len:242 (+) Transcript_4782:307-1032(+)
MTCLEERKRGKMQIQLELPARIAVMQRHILCRFKRGLPMSLLLSSTGVASAITSGKKTSWHAGILALGIFSEGRGATVVINKRLDQLLLCNGERRRVNLKQSTRHASAVISLSRRSGGWRRMKVRVRVEVKERWRIADTALRDFRTPSLCILLLMFPLSTIMLAIMRVRCFKGSKECEAREGKVVQTRVVEESRQVQCTHPIKKVGHGHSGLLPILYKPVPDSRKCTRLSSSFSFFLSQHE